MPSGYPTAIDNFTDPTAVNNLSDAPVLHHSLHSNVNDALFAIETELGLSPKGAAASVGARIAAVEAALAAKVNTSQLGAAGGVATLDGGGKLVQNLDAANINSGTVNLLRIPSIPGAKVLGTVGGGSLIPVDAIPPLGTAQTTSGTFAVARIPGLPGTIITSGTIDAARLPSSVTSNANARVVNDLAGRNAILPVDRVDGMLVLQKDKMILWGYRADNDTFARVSSNVQNTVLVAAVNSQLSALWGDITGLQFDAIAGETYGIDVTVFAICSGTSGVDVRYGWAWTGTGEIDSGVQGPDATVVSPNTSGPGQWGANLADVTSPLQPNSVTGAVGLPSGLNVTHQIYATYRCTTAGTVKLQFAQDISSPTFPATAQKGSRLRAERLV